VMKSIPLRNSRLAMGFISRMDAIEDLREGILKFDSCSMPALL